jgi:voltage-gated potassium channel
MITPQAQVSGEPAEKAVVCPQCGAVLEQAGAGVTVIAAGPELDSPLTWHRERPGYPPPPGCRRIWVPLRGFLDVDDDIRRRVERFFNVPMLTLALLVLPLLVVDYYVARGGGEHNYPRLAFAVMCCHFALSVAFLVEFLVKIRIAQSRVSYLARNWIDLIIIVLPFLRPFRALRVARLYAVRGVGLKAVRTMVPVMLGLRFTQRFRRGSEAKPTRPDYSKWPRAALVLELERLQKKLAELERGRSTEGGKGGR